MKEFMAVLLLVISPEFLPEKNVMHIAFSDLPPVCATEYDPFLRRERKAIGTKVVQLDFDCDGQDELIVWNGQSGTGGEVWYVFSRNKSGIWKKAGEVFGVLSVVTHLSHKGLLVCIPCGWDQAKWNYYELKNGDLVQCMSFEVNYAKPVRKEPKKISIEILK